MNRDHFLKKQIYQRTISLINECCLLNDVDETHGVPHAIQIASHVQKAIDSMSNDNKLSEEDEQLLIMAALLHDVDDRKYFNTQNYKNARDITSKVVEKEENQLKIIRMVDLVSFSKNGNNIYPNDPQWYYYPRYADRVEAIGLIGIHRCFQYSFIVKNPFFTQQTPKPKTKQQLYTVIQGRDKTYIQRGGKSISVIDHMFDKILHIKLPIQNLYLESLYQHGHDYVVDFILLHSKNGYVDAQDDLLQRVKVIKETKNSLII